MMNGANGARPASGSASSDRPYDITVIGAGMAGLVVAYTLLLRFPAIRTAILERANRPGGQVITNVDRGYTFEHGPTSMIWNPNTARPLDRLGLGDRVQHADLQSRDTYLWARGDLHVMPRSAVAAGSTHLLSWQAKARVLAEPLLGHREAASEESAGAFAARRFGATASHVIAGAVVQGGGIRAECPGTVTGAVDQTGDARPAPRTRRAGGPGGSRGRPLASSPTSIRAGSRTADRSADPTLGRAVAGYPPSPATLTEVSAWTTRFVPRSRSASRSTLPDPMARQ